MGSNPIGFLASYYNQRNEDFQTQYMCVDVSKIVDIVENLPSNVFLPFNAKVSLAIPYDEQNSINDKT